MIADVVIVGGGIVGAACAYYLCNAGLDVCLVERSFPAGGTSRACDGLILLWDKMQGPETELGRASAALWAGLAETLSFDIEYRRNGTIMLAEDGDRWTAACLKAEQLQGAGARAEVLDNAGLRSLEPNLAPDLAGGVYFPDDAQVDARRATLALLDGAERKGLKLIGGIATTGFRRARDGHITGIVTTDGDIATERVVCAAGVWSNDVTRLVGVELPIRPRKGHILVMARVPGVINHPMLEGSYAGSVQSTSGDLQVALVAEMTSAGTLLLGSSREFAGFERSVSLEVIQAIARRAVRFLPGLAHASVIRSYAGLRPWSPDHLPLVGPIETVPGLYVATGHEGAGIGLAPVTGQIIAGWIAGSDLPRIAAELRPDRFAQGRGE